MEKTDVKKQISEDDINKILDSVIDEVAKKLDTNRKEVLKAMYNGVVDEDPKKILEYQLKLNNSYTKIMAAKDDLNKILHAIIDITTNTQIQNVEFLEYMQDVFEKVVDYSVHIELLFDSELLNEEQQEIEKNEKNAMVGYT